MEKTAYEIGVALALEDAGLIEKRADDGFPWWAAGGAALLGGGLGVRALSRGLRGGAGKIGRPAASFKKWQGAGRGAPAAGRSAAGSQVSAGPRMPGVVPGGSSYSSHMPTRRRIH